MLFACLDGFFDVLRQGLATVRAKVELGFDFVLLHGFQNTVGDVNADAKIFT